MCQSCPTTCDTCIRDTTYNNTFMIKCTSCRNGYLIDGNQCSSTCTTYNTVPDYTNNRCTGCDVSCRTCSISATNCTSCNISSALPYYMSLNNQCLRSCPNGYFSSNVTYLCLPCMYPCQFCTSSSVTSCITCVTGYYLDGSVCRNQCP